MSNAPFLCLVWALTDPPPGIPGVGGPGSPGGIWGGGPHPMPPIHHPGHPDHGKPVDPGYGRPGWSPVDPGYGQGRPNRPGNALPDGEDVEIDNELPEVPPEYADKTVVAIKRPHEEWIVKAYDPAQVDNTLPPTPEPK